MPEAREALVWWWGEGVTLVCWGKGLSNHVGFGVR